ncbi:TetR/AcrR family transcriptional regulator [Pyxidicoccus sp. MSG2]|uniref:TetR/AcrR family transcriptional regulator n=1 Tax=Pyxidicoccus sp. MSG2 TaxID=2996790 RepID=UPI002270C3CA|nr:TetR/AcrR family transcriptional regulator [Pyxidicoccus sp. MSG2]MCY1015729.1 TetR/AcrR family transcriptional regulator [Pyxidicoccus sp. MSG2]
MLNRDSKSRKPAQNLRSRLKEATADAILVAAAEVFAEQGLTAARMETIAERAGVSVGTLYNHFDDRAALLDALLKRRREALLKRLDAALAESQGRPFREQLATFLAALADHVAEHGGFLRVLMQSEELVQKKHGQSPSRAELHKRLETLVSRGVRAGQVRPEGQALYPTLLMGMLSAVFHQELGDSQGGGGMKRSLEELSRVFLKGVEV